MMFDPIELIARIGGELATLVSHLPADRADKLVDDLAAGIKQEADALRAERDSKRRRASV